MSGHIGDLSPKQQAALTQFRDKVKDVLKPKHDDAYLLRWLRARSFDLKKSEKMLRDSLEWRKKMGADDILKWTPPEVLQKYYPGGLCGVDKHGFPIWIDTMGFLDLKGILFSVRKADIVKYKVYWTERMYMAIDEQKKKLGREIDGVALIFDMEGIGTNYLWKPAVDVVTEIMCTFEANYPETLQYALVINAPKVFPIVYNLLKPFLSEDTKTKIHVLGDGWKSTVLKHIDADQLPVRWGGTRTDPDGDPCCRSRVNMGGEIPKEYYMERPTKIDLSNFSSVTVARGSTAQLDYTVVEADSVLNWQFWTEDNDVGFGVFRRTCCERQKAGDMVEVVTSQRVNSHFVPEHGSANCDVPGTYVIRFDNTYSWMRTKKVSYLVEVLAPGAMNDIDIKGSQSFQSFYSANSDVMSNRRDIFNVER